MGVFYSEGTHRVEIIRQGFSDGDYGAQFVLGIVPKGNYEERERTAYLPFTDKDGKRVIIQTENGDRDLSEQTLQVIAYLGYAGDDLAVLEEGHPEHVSFVGTVVEAYCKHKLKDNDDGTSTTVERWYINTPRAKLKPVETTTIRKLNALFGKDLAKMEAGKPDVPEAIVSEVIPPAFGAPNPQSVQDEAKQMAAGGGQITTTSGGKDIPF